MRTRACLVLVIVPLIAAFCVSCAGANRSLTKAGRAFSPVTGLFKSTAGRVVSGAKDAGSAAAGDVRRYSTKLPGTTQTSLTPSQQHAIANYIAKKQYEEQLRRYNVDSRIVPKNAKVRVNY